MKQCVSQPSEPLSYYPCVEPQDAAPMAKFPDLRPTTTTSYRISYDHFDRGPPR